MYKKYKNKSKKLVKKKGGRIALPRRFFDSNYSSCYNKPSLNINHPSRFNGL